MRTQTQRSSGIWSRSTLVWKSLGKSLGRGNASSSSFKRPVVGDFLLFCVWVSSLKLSWDKWDVSDLGADLSVVKAAVSKVSKGSPTGLHLSWKVLNHLFLSKLTITIFLRVQFIQRVSWYYLSPTGSLPRHYWCFLISSLHLCGWLEMPNTIIPCTQMPMLWLILISQF